MVCPQKLFFIGLMDVSDDRCPDNPEDSGGVCALCQEITRLRLMWPKGHHMGEGGGDGGGGGGYQSISFHRKMHQHSLYIPQNPLSSPCTAVLMKADQTKKTVAGVE